MCAISLYSLASVDVNIHALDPILPLPDTKILIFHPTESQNCSFNIPVRQIKYSHVTYLNCKTKF